MAEPDAIIRVMALLGEHSVYWMTSDNQRAVAAERRRNEPAWLILLSNGMMERYRDTSNVQDLREAEGLLDVVVSLASEKPAELLPSLRNLATWYRIHHSETSSLPSLESSIRCYRTALALDWRGDGDWWKVVFDLVVCLYQLYVVTKSVEPLQDAARLYESASGSFASEGPRFASMVSGVVDGLCTLYSGTRDLTLLKTATHLIDKALSSDPCGVDNDGWVLYRLATTIKLAYLEDSGDHGLLADALRFLRETLRRQPDGHEYRVSTLTDLAFALDSQFQESGDLQHHEESVQLLREALNLRPHDDPSRDSLLNGLACSLYSRHDQFGHEPSLEEATRLHREALELRPPGHTSRASSLNNLGNCLEDQFQTTGDLVLLDEAIQAHKEALDLLPHGHADRDAGLVNLSLTLEARHRRTGDLVALDDAIRYAEEAVKLCPPGHLHHFDTLTNLAVLQDAIAEHSLELKSLERTKKSLADALLACPVGHPQRPTVIGNLAIALERLYDHTKTLEILESSIYHYREAEQLCPAGDPLWCSYLSRAMYKSFKATHDINHLKSSIEFATHALELFPTAHPSRYACHLRLSEARLHEGTAVYDPVIAIAQLREAAADLAASPRDRLKGVSALLTEVEALLFPKEHEKDDNLRNAILKVYEQTVRLLPRVAYFGLGLEERLRELKGSETLGANAAKHALALHQPTVALELLEESRSVFWTQALRMRAPLRGLPKEQITDLAELFHALEQGANVQENPSNIPDWANAALVERRLRSEKAERIVDSIRQKPGFERFLLSQPFATLNEVTSRGLVVVLVSHEMACDAVVLTGQDKPPMHVRLPGMNSTSLRKLADYVKSSNVRSRIMKKIKIGQSKPPQSKSQSAPDVSTIAEYNLEAIDGTKLIACLWNSVVGPIVEALKLQRATGRNRPRLHWCPTGYFAFLPLHAAGYCSDYVVSSYTPTLTALIQARRALPPLQLTKMKVLLVSEPYAPQMQRIDNVMHEVQSACETLASMSPSVVGDITSTVSGAGARVEQVVAQIEEVSLLHLACHGQQDPVNPLNSAFCLRDGKLSVADLMRLNLSHAFFAFLSACESAKGDQVHPDQAIHLAATMLFVGFRSVIGTMWEMGDVDGPLVANTVYEEIIRHEHLDPDVIPYALDAAVRKLKRQRLPPHRWAPYIHLGA